MLLTCVALNHEMWGLKSTAEQLRLDILKWDYSANYDD